jgi:HK97 family phage major capsid protein
MDLEQLKALLQKSTGEYNDALTEFKSKLDAGDVEAKALKTAFDQMETAIKSIQAEQQRLAAMTNGSNAPNVHKSAGQMFVESAEFKQAAAAGSLSTGTMQLKNITNLAASAGVLTRPDRQSEVVIPNRRPLRVRDLMVTIPTSSNAVEYVRRDVFTNNAAAQAPGSPNTANGAGEMQNKAQSNITYALVSANVRTFAHWIPASRQVLSDAPMLQGLIDADMVYGLDLVSDAQILNGDGTNQNLTGLMVDTSITVVAPDAATATAAARPQAMLEHIRKAITAMQLNDYYNVTGVVLNPTDWATIELAKGTDGQYIWASVASGAEERVWRVPVVITNAMSVGKFLLGDWTMGAKLYDREQASIRISESHASLFIQNAVAILAEERYAMTVPHPKAFSRGTFPTLV